MRRYGYAVAQIETLARRDADRMKLMYRCSSLQGALLAGVLLCAAVCSADTTPAPSEVSVSGKEASGTLFRTLAVLAEGPIGRSSVPDLLFVQLANVPHLSLLERDVTPIDHCPTRPALHFQQRNRCGAMLTLTVAREKI
jgi:hypothetical protein